MSPGVTAVVFCAAWIALIWLDSRTPSFLVVSFQSNRHARRNWSYLVSASVTLVLLRAMNDWMHARVERGTLLEEVPFWGEVLALFLFVEGLNWVIHWVKHAHPWLWLLHFQHHREEHYNIWLTTHTHPLEVCVFGFLVNWVLVLVGFGPESAQVYFLFYSVANTYQHSSRDLSLGWLDRVIVSPRYHRLHHARGVAGNYGSTLTVWDVLLGTAHWPRVEEALCEDIGIREKGEPFGFWAELTQIFRGIPRLDPPVG